MATSVLVLVLLILFALFFPAGAPAAIGAALAANLALGWLLAGPAGPRIALVGGLTIAGGFFGARYLRSGTALGFALVGVDRGLCADDGGASAGALARADGA